MLSAHDVLKSLLPKLNIYAPLQSTELTVLTEGKQPRGGVLWLCSLSFGFSLLRPVTIPWQAVKDF